MKIFLVLAVLGGIAFGAAVAAHHVDAPPKPCTCGPTCPTPTAKPWPIPASMEKLHGK